MTVRELPGVETMASLSFAFSPEALLPAYQAIGAWIHANGYTIAGPCREVYVGEIATPASSMMEIQFPVAGSNRSGYYVRRRAQPGRGGATDDIRWVGARPRFGLLRVQARDRRAGGDGGDAAPTDAEAGGGVSEAGGGDQFPPLGEAANQAAAKTSPAPVSSTSGTERAGDDAVAVRGEDGAALHATGDGDQAAVGADGGDGGARQRRLAR